ncbi:MAG: macro domain-containing protein [Chloroflexota bacterium]|nr:macro domain-containing protein [Chloroflexota bacterium]
MIKVLTGDLLKSPAQTLVNTVNCVGVMGKGIALEFKKRYPAMYEDYVQRCQRGEVRLGEPYLYKYVVTPWILNFPTKDHWRSVAKLDDIVRGLRYLQAHYRDWGITSLAVPPLGCGNGQLEWSIVGPTLYRDLSGFDIPVELYAPHGTPPSQLELEFLDAANAVELFGTTDPKWIQPSAIALVEILHRLEQQPHHPPVGRTVFQKIAFVATAEGLATGLTFQRGSYGPFAPEMKRLTSRLINNGLISECRSGRMINVKVGPTFNHARELYKDDLVWWDEIIERTFDLFMRLDTDQAEIVATVLFAASSLDKRDGKPTERMVFDHVREWKVKRKPPLQDEDVANAIRSLAARGWLRVDASSDLPVPDYLF